jgi:hypothetical protein
VGGFGGEGFTWRSRASQLMVRFSSGSCNPFARTYSQIFMTIPALVSSLVSSRSASWGESRKRSGCSSRVNLMTQLMFSSPFLSNSKPSNSAGPFMPRAPVAGWVFGVCFRHSIVLPSGCNSRERSSSTTMLLKKCENLRFGCCCAAGGF